MIGRVGERRATSRKPAFRKAEASPVHAKTGGISAAPFPFFFGSIGYPSTTDPPWRRTWSAAARSSDTVTPRRRCGLATNRQTTDQTGASSMRARTRDRSSVG